jgi:hypothetical protein
MPNFNKTKCILTARQKIDSRLTKITEMEELLLKKSIFENYLNNIAQENNKK